MNLLIAQDLINKYLLNEQITGSHNFRFHHLN